MVVKNKAPKSISDIKKSISDLETIIWKAINNKTLADKFGSADEIMIKTLGQKYEGPANFEPKYQDNKKNKLMETEYSQVIKALKNYDSNPTQDTKLELLMEVGDIIFQKELVKLKDKVDKNYEEVMKKFSLALSYFDKELKSRNITLDEAKNIAKIKYGVKVWLEENGHDANDEDLEKKMCKEHYDKRH